MLPIPTSRALPLGLLIAAFATAQEEPPPPQPLEPPTIVEEAPAGAIVVDAVDLPAGADFEFFEAAPDSPEFYVGQLNGIVQTEREQMERFLSLGGKQWSELDKKLEKPIQKLAESLHKRHSNNNGEVVWFSSLMELPEPVYKKLTETIQQHLPADQLPGYKKYLEEYQNRRRSHEKITLLACLNLLDRRLALSEEQIQKLKPVLRKNWDAAWNGTMMEMLFATPLNEGLDLPLKDLQPIFTPSQFQTWKALQSSEEDSAILQNYWNEAVGELAKDQWVPVFQKHCRYILQLKTEELDALCQLSEVQKKRIAIISKGVISQLTAKRREALEKFRKQNNIQQLENVGDALAAPVAIEFDQETMATLDSDASALIELNPRWRSYLEKTLDSKQRAVYQKRQSLRNQRKRKVIVASIAQSLAEEIQLASQQTDEFAKILEANLPEEAIGSQGPVEIMKAVTTIPDEQYKKALQGEKWERFQVILEEVRQQLSGEGIVIEAKAIEE